MKGENRRAAIRKIANDRHVSIAVAAQIYSCASIERKQRWAARAERDRAVTGATIRERQNASTAQRRVKPSMQAARKGLSGDR